MAPAESRFGPQGRSLRRRVLVAFVVVAVNPATVIHAQEQAPGEQPVSPASTGDVVAPTIGSAEAIPPAPPDANPAPAQTPPANDPAVPPNAVSGANTSPAEAAPSSRSMMDAVRAAAARQLLPTGPSDDLRLRTLDTSFPAEQPQLDVPEPPRDVVAPPLDALSPRGAARRTVARVVDGVTVLTNVTDDPEDGSPANAGVTKQRFASASALDSPQAPGAMPLTARDVTINANALNPVSKATQSEGLGPWLWLLTGFALLLLVPIGVLLTRPVRRG